MRTNLEKRMRKLIVAAFISLDGVIQSPGGPEEDPSGEFRLGGWIMPYADEAISQALQDLFSQPFELLLGRRTYDIFAAYWPRVRADSASHAIADLFNSVPKHVATHRSDTLDWQNSYALELADAIRALKHRDGANLLTWGSGDMVRQLFAAGLAATNHTAWTIKTKSITGCRTSNSPTRPRICSVEPNARAR